MPTGKTTTMSSVNEKVAKLMGIQASKPILLSQLDSKVDEALNKGTVEIIEGINSGEYQGFTKILITNKLKTSGIITAGVLCPAQLYVAGPKWISKTFNLGLGWTTGNASAGRITIYSSSYETFQAQLIREGTNLYIEIGYTGSDRYPKWKFSGLKCMITTK